MAMSPVTIASPPFSKDRLKGIMEYAIAVLDAANTNLAGVNSNLVSLQSGTSISQLHADILNVYASVDGLETLVGNTNTSLGSSGQLHADLLALKSSVDALLAREVPLDALRYTQALSLAANPTVLNAPGVVYAVYSSGNITIRDGSTDVVQVPGGANGVLPAPVTCSSSIKLLAVLASNVSVWYKAS
jgi:hypothetical protein